MTLIMEERSSKSAGVRSLNDFPKDLLLHILSFLPTVRAIQTAVLSRKWRNLWSSVPSLSFDYPVVVPELDPSDTCLFFSNFVDRTLLTRSLSSSLLKFRLQFDYYDKYYHGHIDTWLRYAVDPSAAELHLDFFLRRTVRTYHGGTNPSPVLYDFPFSALRNDCVRILRLCYCDLTLPASMPTNMRLLSLRSIRLDQVFVTDWIISELLEACTNLEEFDLRFCGGMKDLKICSSKLKVLSLSYFHCNDGSLEISCPNLHSLCIICFEVGNYSLKNGTSLVEAEVSFLHKWNCHVYWIKVIRLLGHVERLCVQNWWLKVIRLLGHVKRLSVQNWWHKLLESKYVLPQGFAFYNLKCLKLQSSYTKYHLLAIAALLDLSPNVETMILDRHYREMEEDESLSEEVLNESIHLSLPSLREIKIKDFKGTESELELVKRLKQGGVVLEKIVLVPPIGDDALLTVLVRQPHGGYWPELVVGKM